MLLNSITARQHGYNVYVKPSSIVYHKIHKSTIKTKGSITYYTTRNILFLLERKFEYRDINWIDRFFIDLKRIFHFLFNLNIRASYNIIKGYNAWMLGYQGPIDRPVRVRCNILKKILLLKNK